MRISNALDLFLFHAAIFFYKNNKDLTLFLRYITRLIETRLFLYLLVKLSYPALLSE